MNVAVIKLSHSTSKSEDLFEERAVIDNSMETDDCLSECSSQASSTEVRSEASSDTNHMTEDELIFGRFALDDIKQGLYSVPL